MANEKRLIDASRFENSIQLSIESWCRDCNSNAPVIVRTYKDVLSRIRNAPTVDAIVPPVNIGQILWCNIPHSEFPLECRVYCICREERNGLVLDYFRCTVKGWFGKAFSFEDVGKTVFLTEAEALAKMDGGNEDGEN